MRWGQPGRHHLGGAGASSGRASRVGTGRAALAGADGAAAGVPSAMAQAYRLGVALARTGRIREAVEHRAERGRGHAHDLLQAACRGYTNLGVLYSTLDPKRAIDTAEQGLETAKKIEDLGLRVPTQHQSGGRLPAPSRTVARSKDSSPPRPTLDLDRQLGQLDHLAVPLIVLGQIQQCHGDPALALATIRRRWRSSSKSRSPSSLPCYDGLATLYLDRGDHARAGSSCRRRSKYERAGG